MDGIAAEQMGYMREFYEKNNFHTLRPVSAICENKEMDKPKTEFDMFRPLLTANGDMSTVVVYFPPYARHAGAEIRYLQNKSYNISWFNPRDGKGVVLEENFIPEDGKYSIPNRPDKKDWVLVLNIK